MIIMMKEESKPKLTDKEKLLHYQEREKRLNKEKTMSKNITGKSKYISESECLFPFKYKYKNHRNCFDQNSKIL